MRLLIKSKREIVAAVGKDDPDAVLVEASFLDVLRDGMKSGDPYCLGLGKKLNIVLPEK